MSEFNTRISSEIGKIKGNIKLLSKLLKQTPLNKDDCRDIILEIKKSLKVIWELIQDITIDHIKNLDFSKRFLFAIIAGKEPETFLKEAFKYPAYESDINSVISRLDSEYYKDKEVKDGISTLVENLESELAKLELKLGLRQGLMKISEFLTKYSLFTENWAVAACYLSAMEIMVNKKLQEYGLETGKGFKDSYERLLGILKEKDVEISELESRLPKVFWEVRNKVVHEGYSPNADELETIVTYVDKVLSTITMLR